MNGGTRWTWMAVAVATVLATGCGSAADLGGPGLVGGGAGAPNMGGGAGDFGATQGGVQDMGLARQYVAEGFVPPPAAFVVEGMFSEHDLPLTGPTCHTTLCLRAAMGVAPTHDGTESAWMQVGMSSTIDPESFVREPQTLVLTVDVSGSMGWGYDNFESDYPSAGSLSRALLHEIAAELGPEDRVALVTYGSSVSTVLPLVAGDDPQLGQAIDALTTDGSTNMEAGLTRAYEIAADEALSAAGRRAVRVMLFTDVQPNVGATSETEFQRIVGGGVEQGVGITVFGLGMGLGPELFEAMSHLRGGNAFSLTKSEHVGELMADSWPWMVSPIAYDLVVDLAASEGYRVAEAYGFPGHEEDSVGFEVASVFLSRRRGGMLLRLEPADGGELAGLRVDGTLSYQDLQAGPVSQDLSGHVDGSEAVDPKGRFFEQDGVAKSVALALLVSGMHEAAELYGTDPEGAAEHMLRVRDRFVSDAEALGDAALDVEETFAQSLLVLMESGAEQRDLYGY